jgi:hypothetical protein
MQMTPLPSGCGISSNPSPQTQSKDMKVSTAATTTPHNVEDLKIFLEA